MHYYQFNIGDYASHTMHLDESEDLAYRRMIDYCYLHESGFPDNIEKIGRLIRMRTHSESIANVLQEFFFLENGEWINGRIMDEIAAFREKSEKARESARKRWERKGGKNQQDSANAMRPHSEGNAKQEPLTINQEPDNNTSSGDDLAKRSTQNIPYTDIVNLFNQICVSLPAVIKVTDKRRKAIKSIWNDDTKHQQLEFWEWYFKKVEASDFLAGRIKPWMAGFDWILKNANFVKVIEKHYDN